ncbi:MAG: hypothetical protein JWM12_2767, partial [Ilumatobacteraceae bacterium]|nr:hypothetical protein [Ilumatobacteraceae bacterium]
TPSTTPTTPGGPGCGLGDAASFCETFDAPHNGGTQTGDLDPVLWGVSRVADANPGSEINGIVPSHNACANGAPTPPPADAQICNGQYVESLNDGGSVATINAYPKQPFSFAGRTGTVVFDVSADSEGTHAAWPEFVITGEPVPGVRREISVQPTPHAINEIGFALDTGCAGQDDTTGVGVIFTSVNNVYQEVQNSRPNCITKGSSAAMNHIEVRVSTTHIEVWGTDAGSTTLKQLAVEDIPGGLAFSQGLVWLDDAHYNARKSIEPCACGTQFDHSFAWDNLGFDGPKTYRDRGFDIELGNALSGRSIQGDAQVQLGFSAPTDGVSRTVTGVEWSQTPTSVKVVMNAYSFDETQPQVSINGGPFHTIPWDAPNDSTYAWRSLSIPNIPMSEVHAGTNTITFKGNSSTIIANPSLILVAAAPVP